MWWQALVIPATQEAEAGGQLEPGGEAAMSQDSAMSLRSGRKSKTLPQKKEKEGRCVLEEQGNSCPL